MVVIKKNQLPTEPSNVNTNYNGWNNVNQTVPNTAVSDMQKMQSWVDKTLQWNLAKKDYFWYNPSTTQSKKGIGWVYNEWKNPEYIPSENEKRTVAFNKAKDEIRNEFKNSIDNFANNTKAPWTDPNNIFSNPKITDNTASWSPSNINPNQPLLDSNWKPLDTTPKPSSNVSWNEVKTDANWYVIPTITENTPDWRAVNTTPVPTNADWTAKTTTATWTENIQYTDANWNPYDLTWKSQDQIKQLLSNWTIKQKKVSNVNDKTTQGVVDTPYWQLIVKADWKTIDLEASKDIINQALANWATMDQINNAIAEAELTNETDNLKTSIDEKKLMDQKIENVTSQEDIKSYWDDPVEGQKLADEFNWLQNQYQKLYSQVVSWEDEYWNKLDERQLAQATMAKNSLEKQLAKFVEEKSKNIKLSEKWKAKLWTLDSEKYLEDLKINHQRDVDDNNRKTEMLKQDYALTIQKIKDWIWDNIFWAWTIMSKDWVNYIWKNLNKALDDAKLNYERAEENIKKDLKRNQEDFDSNFKNTVTKLDVAKEGATKVWLQNLITLQSDLSIADKWFSTQIKGINKQYKINIWTAYKVFSDAMKANVDAFTAKDRAIAETNSINSKTYNENLKMSIDDIWNQDIFSARAKYEAGHLWIGQYETLISSIKSEASTQLRWTWNITKQDTDLLNSALNSGQTVNEAVTNVVMWSKWRLKFPMTKDQISQFQAESDAKLAEQKIQQDIDNSNWNKQMDIANYNQKQTEFNKPDNQSFKTDNSIITVDKSWNKVSEVPFWTATQGISYINTKDGTPYDTTWKTQQQINVAKTTWKIKEVKWWWKDYSDSVIFKSTMWKAVNWKITSTDIEKTLPSIWLTADQFDNKVQEIKANVSNTIKNWLSEENRKKYAFTTTNSKDYLNPDFRNIDIEELNIIPYWWKILWYIGDEWDAWIWKVLKTLDNDTANKLQNTDSAVNSIKEVKVLYDDLYKVDPNIFWYWEWAIWQYLNEYIKWLKPQKDEKWFVTWLIEPIMTEAKWKLEKKLLELQLWKPQSEKIMNIISNIQSKLPLVITPLWRSLWESWAFTDSDFINYSKLMWNMLMNKEAIDNNFTSLLSTIDDRKYNTLKQKASDDYNMHEYKDYFKSKKDSENAWINSSNILKQNMFNWLNYWNVANQKVQQSLVNWLQNNTSKNQNPFAKKNTQTNQNTQATTYESRISRVKGAYWE